MNVHTGSRVAPRPRARRPRRSGHGPIPLPRLIAEALDDLERRRAAAALSDGPAGYLTHREAAAYLRLSPRTLDTLVGLGEVHPARAGRRKRLYAPDALDAYLRARARR